MLSVIEQFHCHSKLIENLPGVFYRLKLSKKKFSISFISNQCFQLLGYPRAHLTNQSCKFYERLLHPDDLEYFKKSKFQTLGITGICTIQYRCLTKSGETKYFKDEYTSYQEGSEWFIEGYATEVPQLSLRGKLLHQLKAYRDAVDVNMISSITDTIGKIVYANENFCKISRYSAQELVGQNHRIICSGHHPKAYFEELWRTISSGNLWHGEILNKTKDGALYWVDTVIIPIFDDQRRIINYLSLRMLITSRKKSEEQKKQYTQSLEKIAFMIAHDIRGPLCSIIGLTNILVNQNNTPQETKQALVYLEQSATHLNELTKKLSFFIYENEIELKTRDFNDRIAEDSIKNQQP